MKFMNRMSCEPFEVLHGGECGVEQISVVIGNRVKGHIYLTNNGQPRFVDCTEYPYTPSEMTEILSKMLKEYDQRFV